MVSVTSDDGWNGLIIVEVCTTLWIANRRERVRAGDEMERDEKEEKFEEHEYQIMRRGICLSHK